MSCIKTLKEKGLKLTPQRRLIVDAIHETNVHLTTEEIIAHVQARMPEVHKSTIYRTLDLLEKAGCELNVLVGLCVGHDTLFIQHSKAPVSVVLVKDRVTGNNPGAVLFSYYHRNRMWAEYGGEPEDNRI